MPRIRIGSRRKIHVLEITTLNSELNSVAIVHLIRYHMPQYLNITIRIGTLFHPRIDLLVLQVVQFLCLKKYHFWCKVATNDGFYQDTTHRCVLAIPKIPSLFPQSWVLLSAFYLTRPISSHEINCKNAPSWDLNPRIPPFPAPYILILTCNSAVAPRTAAIVVHTLILMSPAAVSTNSCTVYLLKQGRLNLGYGKICYISYLRDEIIADWDGVIRTK